MPTYTFPVGSQNAVFYILQGVGVPSNDVTHRVKELERRCRFSYIRRFCITVIGSLTINMKLKCSKRYLVLHKFHIQQNASIGCITYFIEFVEHADWRCVTHKINTITCGRYHIFLYSSRKNSGTSFATITKLRWQYQNCIMLVLVVSQNRTTSQFKTVL